MYPNAAVLHAPALASDHLPLILNTEGHYQRQFCPFKFEAMWVRDPGSYFTVADAWRLRVTGCPTYILSKKLDKVKKRLKLWNKNHFGFIKDRIHSLSCALDALQQQGPSVDNIALEASIKAALHEQLQREQSLWQQRSHVEWLVSKELNTKFFHMSTVVRRNQNSILSSR